MYYPNLYTTLFKCILEWIKCTAACKDLFCATGSDQVPYRLPILPTCLPVPHQDVAPQYLWGKNKNKINVMPRPCLITICNWMCCVSHLTVKCFPLSQNGDVCISILHPPVDDPQSGELPSERWNPTQNVRWALARTRYLVSCVSPFWVPPFFVVYLPTSTNDLTHTLIAWHLSSVAFSLSRN